MKKLEKILLIAGFVIGTSLLAGGCLAAGHYKDSQYMRIAGLLIDGIGIGVGMGYYIEGMESDYGIEGQRESIKKS